MTTCLGGKLCVLSTAGVTDDTVFGKKATEVDEESDDDCEKVQHAIKMLDKYVRA